MDCICYDSVSEQSSITIGKLEVNAIGSRDGTIVTLDKGCDFFEADTVSNESFSTIPRGEDDVRSNIY